MADKTGKGSPKLTLAAAAMVLLLALGALLWPRSQAGGGVPLLVFDPSGRPERVVRVYEPLARVVAAATGRSVPLTVLTTVADLRDLAARQPAFVLCPDGLALRLDQQRWGPVAVGRRAVPRNLRPRGVLLSRRGAAAGDQPWLTQPRRTVLGDSLALTAVGVWDLAAGGNAVPRDLRVGPDPYDHGPVLHALRLGGFDHALVRQWDADRFFATGLLSEAEWTVTPVTIPVPDVVLMASRALSRGLRLAVGEQLTTVGRGAGGPAQQELRHGLEWLHLAGFNLLIDPDLDLVRRQLRDNWPRSTD